jgi:hypothetical protein
MWRGKLPAPELTKPQPQWRAVALCRGRPPLRAPRERAGKLDPYDDYHLARLAWFPEQSGDSTLEKLTRGALAPVAVGSCPMLLRRLLRAAQADAARPDRGPHLCSEWRMRRQSGAVADEG